MFIFTMRIFHSVRNPLKLSSFSKDGNAWDFSQVAWDLLGGLRESSLTAWEFAHGNYLLCCLLLNVDGKKSLGRKAIDHLEKCLSHQLIVQSRHLTPYSSSDGEIKREEGLNSHLIYELILLSKSSKGSLYIWTPSNEQCTIFVHSSTIEENK